jgi:hypothetical protein
VLPIPGILRAAARRSDPAEPALGCAPAPPSGVKLPAMLMAGEMPWPDRQGPRWKAPAARPCEWRCTSSPPRGGVRPRITPLGLPKLAKAGQCRVGFAHGKARPIPSPRAAPAPRQHVRETLSVALRSATGFRPRRQGDWVWSSAAVDHRGSCFAPYNVRAERTTEAGRLGPATDNTLLWLLPAQGGLPRRVRSRARC